jgi:hypothetical protein
MRRRVLINASFVGAPRSLRKVIKIESDSAGTAAPRRPLYIARVLCASPRTGKSRSEIGFDVMREASCSGRTLRVNWVALDRQIEGARNPESRTFLSHLRRFVPREEASRFRLPLIAVSLPHACIRRDATRRRGGIGDPKLARPARENEAARASPIGDNRRRGARMRVGAGRLLITSAPGGQRRFAGATADASYLRRVTVVCPLPRDDSLITRIVI